jgi:hypothetical protein
MVDSTVRSEGLALARKTGKDDSVRRAAAADPRATPPTRPIRSRTFPFRSPGGLCGNGDHDICTEHARGVPPARRLAMTAALVFLRAGLRNRWRGWLGLALIVGLFGGAVEGAAAGARRTDSAYPLLVAWSKAPDMLIYSLPGQPTFVNLAPAALERLP